LSDVKLAFLNLTFTNVDSTNHEQLIHSRISKVFDKIMLIDDSIRLS